MHSLVHVLNQQCRKFAVFSWYRGYTLNVFVGSRGGVQTVVQDNAKLEGRASNQGIYLPASTQALT
eukprot:765017-Pelagomonas_calceolata.AAC.4